MTRTADGREAAANRIIVAFKPGVSDAEQDAIHRTVAARAAITPAPVSRVNGATQYVNITGALSPDTVIQSYRADPRVRYAEPDYLVRALDTPNDASFGDQYGLRAIQAAAWNLTHGAPSVKIAILDCGIHEAHPDLIGKVVARQDFTGSVYGTDDRCNHGTHVAGIASANTNNTIGVAGVGYTTSLLNGKVLDDGASGTISGVADGIRWATDNGAKVISMSLGGDGTCPTSVQDAIDAAWSRNVVVVAVAGNSGSDQAFFPAGCAHVIAVASTDASDARSSFSNYGTWVQVAAPGTSILSTVNPDLNGGVAYGTKSGTSMATPHVAGLVGLVWATRWGTGAQAVMDRLEATADPIAGTGTNWRYGRINAAAAVAPPDPPPAATALSVNTVPVGSAGFTLTVTGSNFRPNAHVLWNGASRPADSVTATRITTAIAAADIATAGTVHVGVANSDGTVSTPDLTFTIMAPPPRPTTLTPPSGGTGGGTVVTITGAGFQPGATVRIGGAPATVTAVTATRIVVTAPAHAVGGASVVVTNPDGQAQTLTDAYTYGITPEARSGTSPVAISPPSPPASRAIPSPASAAISARPIAPPPSR